MPGLSAAELSFLEGGIAQDLRNDGRGREDFRSFSIQLDVISQVIDFKGLSDGCDWSHLWLCTKQYEESSALLGIF
jgi:hypothetical protein